MRDMEIEVKEWEHKQYEILIGVDMNEGCINKSSQVQRLLNNTTLLPLVDILEAPATYARGATTIKFFFGTPNIKMPTRVQGYLPFHKGGGTRTIEGYSSTLI
jgi:hypothetical protein